MSARPVSIRGIESEQTAGRRTDPLLKQGTYFLCASVRVCVDLRASVCGSLRSY